MRMVVAMAMIWGGGSGKTHIMKVLWTEKHAF